MTREELMRNAKPILFNTEMVRAILDGKKTVTRRVIKDEVKDKQEINKNGKGEYELYDVTPRCGIPKGKIYKTPYQPGDILYVRETFVQAAAHIFWYKSDKKSWINNKNMPWKPSIHMPKEAARIFLKVTDVRVEKLQDITDEEAKREGSQPQNPFDYDVNKWPNKEHFKEIWNSTVKKSDIDRYGWGANPWVWVIEFERIGVRF